MNSTYDATKMLRDTAARAFISGNRRQAFDLYRCDPQAGHALVFEQWEESFARDLVQRDPRQFSCALLKQGYDNATLPETRETFHKALDALDRMEDGNVSSLEYALRRARPHTLAPSQVAEIVGKIMGVR
jgi:hypothetical protein